MLVTFFLVYSLIGEVMNGSYWASFEVLFPDGRKQTFCCELTAQATIDGILEYLELTNAKLVSLTNFMYDEVQRLKEERLMSGDPIFMVS